VADGEEEPPADDAAEEEEEVALPPGFVWFAFWNGVVFFAVRMPVLFWQGGGAAGLVRKVMSAHCFFYILIY
jgi:hypothetical protein